MTQITKQFLVIVTLLAFGSISGLVWAQDLPSVPDRAVAFCQRVLANKGDEASLLSELETITSTVQSQTLKRLEDRRAEQLAQIRELRDSAQFELKTNIRNLSSKAKTTEQKSAVEAFDNTVAQAMTNRNSIVDSAQETFRSSFSRILRERQTKMVAAVSKFRNDYAQIFRTTVSECSVAGGEVIARDNFLKAAKTIRQNLVVQLSPSQSIAETKPLAIARNLLIQEANDRFLDELRKAERALRMVF